MTWYCIDNPKVFTKKLLELINEFSKVAGYKVKIQKYVAFLYTNKRAIRKEKAKKKKAFKIASKRIKYLEKNLIKEIKKLNSGNFIKQW